MSQRIPMAAVSSKGQITIPREIRKRLHIKGKGDLVGFESAAEGVMMKRLVVTPEEEDFTAEEWEKLEKLANQKGKSYTNAGDFLVSLEEL
ncbi:MAG: AbrB/MazE/SpoVT family DNA-binding domain-containing protein [bacterium]|nr:AbrB/MazE/SpoVT family DNA-binding domain-containing protein [bacterium]